MVTTQIEDSLYGAAAREERSSGGFFYDGVAAGRDVRAGLSRRAAATRPLPMEDVCFFVKTIDNSRLVRVVDPNSGRECAGLVVCVSALFVIALLYVVPCLAMLRTGYRIQDLQKENQELTEASRQLQVKEAVLRDPQRIYTIARGQLGLNEPTAEQVVWPDADGTPTGRELMARNSADSIVQRVK